MSRIASEIRGEISSLTQLLTQRNLSIDSRIAQLKVRGQIYEVGWSKDGANIAPILKDISYPECYRFLHDNQQYNLVLPDGALVQFLYRFERESLIEHRICYFPQPKGVDPSIEHEVDFQEPPIIRIDFNPGQHKSITHSATHLHLGYTKHCRIPTSAPVAASTFMLFILRSFYPDKLTPDLEKILLDEPRSFPESILEEELAAVHLHVPSLR